MAGVAPAPRTTSHGPSSPDQVVLAIKRGILLGRFVPGQRLIEADLTRDLRVSRGPVREALKRLAAEGVIVLSPHRGAYIRALSRREVLDLMQVLRIVVGLAVRLAAMRLRKGHPSDALRAAFERLEMHGPSGDRVLQSIDRTAFYDAVFEIAGNQELIRINPVVPTQILRMQIHPYLTVIDRNAQFADYRVLFDALVAGDGRTARRIVDLHLRRSTIQIRRLPEESFAADPTPGMS